MAACSSKSSKSKPLMGPSSQWLWCVSSNSRGLGVTPWPWFFIITLWIFVLSGWFLQHDNLRWKILRELCICLEVGTTFLWVQIGCKQRCSCCSGVLELRENLAWIRDWQLENTLNRRCHDNSEFGFMDWSYYRRCTFYGMTLHNHEHWPSEGVTVQLKVHIFFIGWVFFFLIPIFVLCSM